MGHLLITRSCQSQGRERKGGRGRGPGWGRVCLWFEVLCGVSHDLSLRDMGVTGKERVWQGSGRFPPMEARVGVLGGVLFSDLLRGPRNRPGRAPQSILLPLLGSRKAGACLGRKKTRVPNLPPGPSAPPTSFLMVPKSALWLTQQGWGYRAGVALAWWTGAIGEVG